MNVLPWILFVTAAAVSGYLALCLRVRRRDHAAAIAAVTMAAYEKANADIDAETRAMYRDGLAAQFRLGRAKAAWTRYRSIRQAGRLDLVMLRAAVAEVDAALMGVVEEREVANG